MNRTPIRAENHDPATHHLTPEQADAFGRELDAIRDRVVADLGQADVDYIRRVIKAQRTMEIGGRACCSPASPAGLAGRHRPAGVSKILDNMEIGHNVMHGQYDWIDDPALSRRHLRVGHRLPGDAWRHSHNYTHHTYTNIVGMDRDIGYGILRMSDDQPWRPYYLGQAGLRLPAHGALPVRGGPARARDRTHSRR